MSEAERIERALSLIFSYGGVGGHHKQWVLDQIVRVLTEGDYADWVEKYRTGEDGPETYEWDKGIEP